MGEMEHDAVEITLRSYQAAARRYLDGSPEPRAELLSFLDRFADAVGTGRVLEIGSGAGAEATYLEQHGLTVARSDATPAFVEMMRAAGNEASLIDVRSDDLGGPWDAVLAHAVLLHLDREQFTDALERIHRATVPGGVMGITLKEGDGDAWSEAKLGLPRFFTYWREEPLRRALAQAGWSVVALDHVAGRLEPWLFVIARTRDVA
jgi:SAM-dependent methyltransferase